MLELEDVTTNWLEAEGHILAKAIVEHVLWCLRSQDPQVSLEPVMQGLAEQILEAAQVGVREAVKVIAERFDIFCFVNKLFFLSRWTIPSSRFLFFESLAPQRSEKFSREMTCL
jgi:hypothetical protein